MRWVAVGLAVTLTVCGWMAWWALRDREPVFGMDQAETIRLGENQGISVAEGFTDGNGHVSFERDGATIEGYVRKAVSPNVALVGARVYLVAVLEGEEPGTEYVLMVDDEYWGRRVQPNSFREGSFSEDFVMGYRLKGRILQDGEPVEDANVSLEGRLAHAAETVVFWDSLEFNELLYSNELETWVEGAIVYAPLRTDVEGRFSFIAPKGHGAVYQRDGDYRDGTAETIAQGLSRHLALIEAAYLGRKVELKEDVEVELDILSGELVITGTVGAMLRVGTLDDGGQFYTVSALGEVNVSGLPAGEQSIVQFKRNAWGEWDDQWGCPRELVELECGETKAVTMGEMEYYDLWEDTVAGRVHERMGVPAAGIDIVAIDWETAEVVCTIATTDSDGYWEAELPEEGFGGDPWIHDGKWGSVPILGFPYSDVVLGARAYSSFSELFKPEAWRKKDRGHKNFQYVQNAVVVQSRETDELYQTEEAAYGGWQTVDSLSAFQYVEDLEELLVGGPQERTYRILEVGGGPDGEDKVLTEEFTFPGQSFESSETLPGRYRASGHYPQAKFLIGGKISGNVVSVKGSYTPQEHISSQYSEALRVGLEFGEHEAYVEMQQDMPAVGGEAAEEDMAGIADFMCPYCGGPAHRDPSNGSYARGFCVQCADKFGGASAMDCRTYFQSPTLAALGGYHLQGHIVRRRGGGPSYEIRFHWRPDLYEESDDFMTQAGIAQPTNAPRWVAKHVDEMGDGKGFGHYDASNTPPFTAGHDVAYFEALEEIEHELGLTQMKLVLASGYTLTEDVEVSVECVLGDDTTETVAVVLAAGLNGDIVPIRSVPKLRAEKLSSPYQGVGLYKGVNSVSITSGSPPAGLRFAIVNDNPWLNNPNSIRVKGNCQTPTAVQLWFYIDGPHMCVGVAGGVWMAYCNDTGVAVVRRASPQKPWEQMAPAFTGGTEQHPCICCLPAHEILVCATLSGRTWIRRSRDWATSWVTLEGEDMLLNDLANGTIVQAHGIVYGVGYADGMAYAEISDTGGASKIVFAHGGTQTAIGACDDAQPTLEVMPTGEIIASLPRDGRMYTYKSADFGETWTYLELLA